MKFIISTLLVLNSLLDIYSLGLKSAKPLDYESALSKRHGLEAGVHVHECLVPGTFALTFDDGPSKYTKKLLNILKSYNVKATFFVVGGVVDGKYGGVLKDIQNDGHQIASHTYSHPHLDELSDEKVNDEVTKTNDAIKKRIGSEVDYLRCPYGECNERVLEIFKKRGLKVIRWNFDTRDWSDRPYSEIIDAYLYGLPEADSKAPGIISLHHDGHSNTVSALPRLIEIIRKKGYKLTTVKECMDE